MADKFTTTSGIDLEEVYTTGPAMNELPGQFPFTRGIQPDMYRGKLWTIRQYAGYSTAEESNLRYKYLLNKGTTGLSVAFDLPTQIGYDSDHALAQGEVGKVGVAIDTIEDMQALFADIPLDTVTTSMTINATAAILLCMYVAVAKRQGADLTKLSGTVQNDILKEYAARGTYIYPPKASMRLITDLFAWSAVNIPKWNTISISGYHMREAGCTASQELAFTMANGKAYLQAALEAGLDINVFGRRLSFFFNCHNEFFEEIAKFRAARRMWAHLSSQLGATDTRAMQLRFHCQTGGSTLTAQQPMNNIVRTSYQAMAAVLGGAQSLHTNGYDEALSLPTEEAATIALRTQQILAFETGVTGTVDPLAGSFFIESLTTGIEILAWQYIERIDQIGGAVRAIETGYMQNEIASAAYDYQKDLEENRRQVIGVNLFTAHEDPVKNVFQVSDSIQKVQVEKLQAIKAQRNNTAVYAALEAVKQVAAGGENLMPLILEAVERKATLGEISDALRVIFSEYVST